MEINIIEEITVVNVAITEDSDVVNVSLVEEINEINIEIKEQFGLDGKDGGLTPETVIDGGIIF